MFSVIRIPDTISFRDHLRLILPLVLHLFRHGIFILTDLFLFFIFYFLFQLIYTRAIADIIVEKMD